MNQNNPSKKRIPLIVKIIAVGFVLAAPVLAVVLTFKPMVDNKSHQQLIEKYSLPVPYDQDDFEFMMVQMRQDREFDFYFYALDDDQESQAVSEAWNILDQKRSKEELLHEIYQIQAKVQSLTVLFNNLEFDKNYLKDPAQYNDLNDILWRFITSEFKLTILSLCFKATYDNRFSLDWQAVDLEAAKKLHAIVQVLKSP